jgi:hypothetical protein
MYSCLSFFKRLGYFFFCLSTPPFLSRQLKLDRFPRPPTFGPDFGTEDPPLNGLEHGGNISSSDE